ncbi:hypothetical protein [Allosediminivita pacifica]|uniref:Uncharacterized protein n=1 Tax=Allosediminivita pacifica TaxID=1267769 RepID=A0A2T6ARI2_9RHOB|nr:hypothetical protein [Allosediminivita pacifica]PTX46438.1 hypothetical protein C8N44_11613 [Allosediminivita pacifica]
MSQNYVSLALCLLGTVAAVGCAEMMMRRRRRRSPVAALAYSPRRALGHDRLFRR